MSTIFNSTSGAESETNGVGHGFGTAPVYLATISTILGAILFLRFGYAVAHTGLSGALLIILLGHLVSIPTALAIAEIATNRRVEGGGVYFIVSRSFGSAIGGTIGIALFLSQAVSVAFYMIAFAEAFSPLRPWVLSTVGLDLDLRMISLPASLALALVAVYRGASFGVRALWAVVAVLGISLVFFFLGSPLEGAGEAGLFSKVENPDSFMIVFAIVFPAFTGMTAGVGLSGDLVNPKRAIPLGIISATLTGAAVYVAAVFMLAISATPEQLAADQLIMSRISLWGPIIPVGLACATLSSAIGSILVAPRTLQALAADGFLPARRLNDYLAKGEGDKNEPRNATTTTAIIVLMTVAIGSVDFVARIISMFFMVTYGSLCAISFLEHFAARPSYRPTFRSRWYLSLLGAAMCLLLMFQMDPVYAILSIVVMFGIYRGIRSVRGGTDDLAAIFQGAMTQTTRYFQIRLQQARAGIKSDEWRPSVIMVNANTFTRTSPMQLCSWLCHRYGFGTYLHYIKGSLDDDTYRESRVTLKRLIEETQARGSAVFVDTMISPSMRSALAQSLQVPGVTGMDNNTVIFEISTHDEREAKSQVVDGCLLTEAARMNSLVLRHGDHFFGSRSRIHIWLTWHDYKNANLMILLCYILLGHPDWENAEIRIFAAFPRDEVDEQRRKLTAMVRTGRLPISEKNLRVIATDGPVDFEQLVERRSSAADLVLFGFTSERLREKGLSLFEKHPALNDVLFVSSEQQVLIE